MIKVQGNKVLDTTDIDAKTQKPKKETDSNSVKENLFSNLVKFEFLKLPYTFSLVSETSFPSYDREVSFWQRRKGRKLVCD